MKIYAKSVNKFFEIIFLSGIIFFYSGKIFAQLIVHSPANQGSVMAGDSLRIAWSDYSKRPADVIFSLDTGKTWKYLVSNFKDSSCFWRIPDISPRRILLQIEAPTERSMDTILVIREAHDLSEILTAKFSPDGKYFITGGKDKSGRVWLTSDRDQWKQRVFTEPVRAADFIHSSDTAAFAAGNTISVFSTSTNATIAKLGADATINAFAVHPSKKIIAGGCGDGKIIVWDIPSQQRLKVISQPELSAVYCLSFSPDGEKILYSGGFAAGEKSAKIYVHDWEKNSFLTIDDAHGTGGAQRSVFSCSFSPDGKFAASGGEDKVLRIWDISSLTEKAATQQFRGEIRSLCFSPDGRKILCSSADSMIRVLDAANAEELYSLNHKAELYSANYSPTGDTVISAGDFGIIKLWSHTDKDRFPLEIFLKQPMSVQAPEIHSRARKIVAADFPLNKFSSTGFIPKKIFARAKIQLPVNLAELLDRQNYSVTNSGTGFDTLTVSSDPFAGNSLVKIFLRLKENFPSGEIKILSFELSDTSEFVPRIAGDSSGKIFAEQPYKFVLSLPEKHAVAGEKFELPLLLAQENSSTPVKISFMLKIDAPGSLLSFGDERIVRGRDTLTIFVDGNSAQNTIALIPVKALEPESDETVVELNIISLEYPDTSDFVIAGQSGKIFVEPLCASGRRASTLSGKLRLAALPNPAEEKFVVEFSLAEDGGVSLALVGSDGEIFSLSEENLPHGEYSREFPVEKFPAGRYQLVLRTKSREISVPVFLVK